MVFSREFHWDYSLHICFLKNCWQLHCCLRRRYCHHCVASKSEWDVSSHTIVCSIWFGRHGRNRGSTRVWKEAWQPLNFSLTDDHWPSFIMQLCTQLMQNSCCVWCGNESLKLKGFTSVSSYPINKRVDYNWGTFNITMYFAEDFWLAGVHARFHAYWQFKPILLWWKLIKPQISLIKVLTCKLQKYYSLKICSRL